MLLSSAQVFLSGAQPRLPKKEADQLPFLHISTYCSGLRIRSCSFFRYSLSVRAISG